MPLQLPTDTQHLRLETRQYELFHRPLGQGIPRRTLYLGVAVCVVWFTIMVIVGVSPLSRFGPLLYIVPPFATVYLGMRVGDDGRMRALRWYDALLARLPKRRTLIRNPLLSAAHGEPRPFSVDSGMTELHPHTDGTGSTSPLQSSLTPLVTSRWTRRRTRLLRPPLRPPPRRPQRGRQRRQRRRGRWRGRGDKQD